MPLVAYGMILYMVYFSFSVDLN